MLPTFVLGSREEVTLVVRVQVQVQLVLVEYITLHRPYDLDVSRVPTIEVFPYAWQQRFKIEMLDQVLNQPLWLTLLHLLILQCCIDDTPRPFILQLAVVARLIVFLQI